MKISFTLNGTITTVNVPPEKRLVDVLREDCDLRATKAGCYAGECGSCTIIRDGDIAQACLIPAFAARESEITTIEGFSKTRAYREIMAGFDDAGYRPCRYCKQSRVLCSHLLLSRDPTPSLSAILDAMRGNTCRCSDISTLVDAIGRIAVLRGGRRHAGR